MSLNKNNIIVGVIIIIGCVIGWFYFKPSPAPPVPNQEQLLKDSIRLLQQQIDSSQIRRTTLEHSYDSLLSLDPLVIIRSRDKINFIYTSATPNQLDSIIRASWKTKPRYD